jgi:hypothetical protein
MKIFKRPIITKEFTNKFGEKMTMVMTHKLNLWIHHEDCNNDFEKMDDFNYILNGEEIDAISSFIDECHDFLNDLF